MYRTRPDRWFSSFARHRRGLQATLSSLILALVLVVAASAAGPQTLAGLTLKPMVTIPGTPTSFAFAPDRTIFVGSANAENHARPNDGVYAIGPGGRVWKVISRSLVIGIAWRRDTLYVGSPGQVEAFSGWTGKRFARHATVLSGLPAGVQGMAAGPDGRLYVGIAAGCDDCKPTNPLQGTVISFLPTGGQPTVVARGLRKPYELVFPTGARSPVVTVVGQDDLGSKAPPEIVVIATPNADFGWPGCTWVDAAACTKSTRPFVFLAPHVTPTGIAASGKSLYIGLYVPKSVVRVAASGGRVVPVITGLPSPVVAIGARKGTLYVGIDSGLVYRVALR